MYTEMAVESNDSVSDIIRAAASSLGYAEIRFLQETAVRAFVTGSDIFLSIPTGGGKALSPERLAARDYVDVAQITSRINEV